MKRRARTQRSRRGQAGRQQPNDRRRRAAAAAAFGELLRALGISPRGELCGTPERAAALWLDHLVAGEGIDLADVLADASPSANRATVSLFDIGVHLVCPHHLTVAFGQAHVAYVPNGRVVGFGTLARVVAAAAARLSLQEDVTSAIADALVDHLGANAAVAVIEAVHPCHNVIHPRSHGARAVTWAARGSPAAAKALAREVRQILARVSMRA